MKRKVLLLTAIGMVVQGWLWGQLPVATDKISLIPTHLRSEYAAHSGITPRYNLNKSNDSYDTPYSLKKYAVSGGVETLANNYILTYFPGGQLRTLTMQDGAYQNLSRKIYNYDGYGNVSSIIHQNWNVVNNFWVYGYRTINTYTPEGYYSSSLQEIYNAGEWEYDGEVRMEYERDAENRFTSLRGFESEDGEHWEEVYVFNYAYGETSDPIVIDISVWNVNLLSYEGFQRMEISEWGPSEFRPDYYFVGLDGVQKITDGIIGKRSELDQYYPADFILYADYQMELGVYTQQLSVTSDYDGEGNRTEIIFDVWNGSDYEPIERYVQHFDDCYGFEGSLQYEYIDPSGWQLDDGQFFEGEKTPYNESCFVSAYDVYEDYAVAEPAGIRRGRWVIEQAPNLSISEEEDKNALQIYPNPAENTVTLNRKNEESAVVKVVGIDGRVYIESEINTSNVSLDVSHLPAGIYTLLLETADDILMHKLVKK